MSFSQVKIEKGKIRKYFPKPKAGVHKWMKNQMNRWFRRQRIDEDTPTTFKRPIKGWEY